MTSLSKEQEEAFEKFKNGENLFISGPGGTGKTHLIKEMVSYANKECTNIQVCAMTGCAALLLECSAKTIHSWSGIKRANKSIDDTCKDIAYSSYYKKSWKKTDILIVDEVSMMSAHIFEMLNTIGKRLRKRMSEPFGGIQVIFVGDFYQLPPVSRDEEEPEKSQFCFQSPTWFDVFHKQNHVILNHIFRQKDPQYKSILLEVREGNISQESIDILKLRVGKPEQDHVTIYPKKYSVDKKNEEMFSKINGPIHDFNVRVDKDLTRIVETDKEFDDHQRFLSRNISKIGEEIEINYLLTGAPISSRLCLKLGARVMCTINKDLEQGICNGSQGIITGFNEKTKIPIVTFDNGVTLAMDYHCWQSEFCPRIGIYQIPIIWAWAITIHKIQGATLDSGEMDVGGHIFEYGQTYVALSRIRSLEGLYLSHFDASRIKANPTVKEFYQDLKIYKTQEKQEKQEKQTSASLSSSDDIKTTKNIKYKIVKRFPNKSSHTHNKTPKLTDFWCNANKNLNKNDK